MRCGWVAAALAALVLWLGAAQGVADAAPDAEALLRKMEVESELKRLQREAWAADAGCAEALAAVDRARAAERGWLDKKRAAMDADPAWRSLREDTRRLRAASEQAAAARSASLVQLRETRAEGTRYRRAAGRLGNEIRRDRHALLRAEQSLAAACNVGCGNSIDADKFARRSRAVQELRQVIAEKEGLVERAGQSYRRLNIPAAERRADRLRDEANAARRELARSAAELRDEEARIEAAWRSDPGFQALSNATTAAEAAAAAHRGRVRLHLETQDPAYRGLVAELDALR